MNTRNFDIRLDGFRYFYRVYPNPASRIEPIVLLTGAFQSLDAWAKLARYVNRIAPVMVIDLPGIGSADPLPARYDTDFLALALLKVMEAERVPRVNVFAASYSAHAAYRFGQLYPGLVNRLALLGVMKEFPPGHLPYLEQSLTYLREGEMDAFVTLVLYGMTCRNGLAQKGPFVRRIMRSTLCNLTLNQLKQCEQNLLRLLNHYRLDLAAPPQVPALIFCGEHDRFTPPRYNREVAAAFSDAVYTTIHRTDHIPHLHQFPTFAGLLSNFFSGRSLESVPGCSPMEYFGRARGAAVTEQIPSMDFAPVSPPCAAAAGELTFT